MKDSPTTSLPMLLTVEQAAEQLGVSRARTYQLLDSGELRSVKVGRLRRIAASDLAAFIATLPAAAARSQTPA